MQFIQVLCDPYVDFDLFGTFQRVCAEWRGNRGCDSGSQRLVSGAPRAPSRNRPPVRRPSNDPAPPLESKFQPGELLMSQNLRDSTVRAKTILRRNRAHFRRNSKSNN